MGQMLLGRSMVKFVPLPVQRGERDADWKFDGKRVTRDVPYVPTPERIVGTMLDVAGVKESDVVYDLGCGDGRIVIAAAERCGARGVGIDIDPRRMQESHANAARAGVQDRVRFLETSLFNVDVSEASVVALYLLPWMNAQLRPKLLAELRPGARIVTHMFPIAAWAPDQVVRLTDLGRVVYGWVVPAKVNGRWQCTVRWPDGRLRRGNIELEQEFQTVLGTAVLNDREVSMDAIHLDGPRLRFQLGQTTFHCRVERDTIRGTGQCPQRRGQFEFRARHA
ncbi:MAG TPA: class I SAM-dependent methyltransferase [Tepidisphaeraceae bacterium]|nr:class I SAM-dependent methyltransferase [Tepidisphaeraceae bacterium]